MAIRDRAQLARVCGALVSIVGIENGSKASSAQALMAEVVASLQDAKDTGFVRRMLESFDSEQVAAVATLLLALTEPEEKRGLVPYDSVQRWLSRYENYEPASSRRERRDTPPPDISDWDALTPTERTILRSLIEEKPAAAHKSLVQAGRTNPEPTRSAQRLEAYGFVQRTASFSLSYEITDAGRKLLRRYDMV